METRASKGLEKPLRVPDEEESTGAAAASTVINNPLSSPAYEAGETPVKLPRPKNIPEFHGQVFEVNPKKRDDSKMDVSQWLRRLDRQLSADIPPHCPPAQAEAYKCTYAICGLQSGAEEWWSSMEETHGELVARCQVSWPTLVHTLEKRFLPDNLEAKTRDFLKNSGHQHTLGMDVEGYYVFFLRLVKQMPGMGSVDQAHAFRQALKYKIQEELMVMTIDLSDLEDVKEHAVKAENKLKNAYKAAASRTGGGPIGKKKGTTGHLTAMQEQPKPKRDKSKDECRICKQLGHHGYECPSKNDQRQ